MSGIGTFLGLMNKTVTVEPFALEDEYGVASYGSPNSYRARVEMKSSLVRDAQGHELVARGLVYLATAAIPGPKDRLTLPAGYEPRQPPILDVRPVEDEGGVHHVVLAIG